MSTPIGFGIAVDSLVDFSLLGLQTLPITESLRCSGKAKVAVWQFVDGVLGW